MAAIQTGALTLPDAPVWLEIIPGEEFQVVVHPVSPAVEIEMVGQIDLAKPHDGRADRKSALWQTAQQTMIKPLRTEKIGRAWRVWFAPPRVNDDGRTSSFG